MKKKIITLIIATVLTSSTLLGCGNTAVEEPIPIAEDKEPVPEEEMPKTEVEETEITEETEAEEELVQEQKYLHLLRTEYHADGSVKDVTKYIYDESGNMTKYISYAADGSIESYVEYENDTNGNCIKSTTYDADGKVTESDESKYDSNNNYLGSTAYDSDGNIIYSSEYEFDDNGNEVKETYCSTFEFDGISTTLKGVYKYEYDDKNRRTKWISYGEDGTTVTNIYEYAYDDAGNEITMTEYDADGSVLSVQNKEYDSDNITKALTLLESAIRCKANIIIFPEFVCCPEVQEAIGSYLRETYQKTPEKMSVLLMVIAGSGWTDDDNNVARVYSYSGILLGKYYKYAAFDDKEKDSQTGMSKERLIEGLHDPGKESIIVEIPDIGIVMTAICRNISNWDYSEKTSLYFAK